MGVTNLVNLLGIWDINLNGVGRELGVEQECSVQMLADKLRADVPVREDLVCNIWSDFASFDSGRLTNDDNLPHLARGQGETGGELESEKRTRVAKPVVALV